ncbi:MAG TPA: hypothetical protein VGE86_01425, partial [Thermoanaerobaculia bacterium]
YYRFIGVEQACSTTPALNTPADTTVALSVPSEASLAGKATTNAVPEKASIVNFVGSSSCSATPCSIELQWPQVTKDVNGKAIYAPEYVVRRETATAAGPIAGSEVTMTATDTNFADNVAGYVDAPPQPAPGVFYRYSVAARQTGGASCTTPLTGAYSDPRNFPCIQMEIAPPTLGWVDGDGSLANPWLISAPWGSIGIKTTLPIAQVSGKLYDMGGTLVATVTGTLTGPDTAVLDVPLSSNNGATYRFAITVADASGCSNTDSRYMTDAVTACCLAPYKMTGGTVFDSTIIKAVGTSGETFDVKLRNLCDDSLTLKAVRISWPTLANPALEWVAFPPAVGTTPITVLSGSLVTPTTILVPATALATVGGGTSTYSIRIEFTNTINGGKDAPSLTVTPIYDRAAASETNTSCRIVQTPF